MKKLLPNKPWRIVRKFNYLRDVVKDWINSWVISGYSKKKKHLYLYGKSNTGKSFFINKLIG